MPTNQLIRVLLWTLTLSAILGFGWFKTTQNHGEREAQRAHRLLMERLSVEGAKENQRLKKWLGQLTNKPDARQQVLKAMADASPLKPPDTAERFESFRWEIQRLGIQVSAQFSGERLVSFGLNYSQARQLERNPKPPPISYTHWTESLRKWIPAIGPWIWLALLLTAVAVGPIRLVAAELLLAVAMACGVAWAVAPHYSVSVSGIFSNDPLFYGLVMYLISVGILGWALATGPQPVDMTLRAQFQLKTLLIVTFVVGALLGMGPFGVFSLCMILVGLMMALAIYFLHKVQARPALAEGVGTDESLDTDR